MRRTLDALLTAIAAVTILVILLHLLPGDPLAAALRDHPVSPEFEAAVRRRWCADCSFVQSVGAYLNGLLHGDLGMSITEQRPVTELLGERLGPTFLLASLTLLIDFTVGLLLGVWSALHPDSIRARLVSAVTMIGYALPSFVIGTLLVWIFALKHQWLPVGGLHDPLLSPTASLTQRWIDAAEHLVLPLTAMVLATIAVPLRQQRTASLEAAAQRWVLAARARGVRPGLVAWRHCWRPALTPIVTLFGLWLPMLVAGAVFVEVVFAWPGVGLLLAHATSERDVPVVMGGGLLLIVAVQLGSLVADAMYRVVDPVQRAR